MRAKGFWNNQQDAFFDVRVFYPFASSYRDSLLASVYRQQEQRKRLEYGKRVRDIERASFTPLVFTTPGGMASEATVFFKRLASILAEKGGEDRKRWALSDVQSHSACSELFLVAFDQAILP